MCQLCCSACLDSYAAPFLHNQNLLQLVAQPHWLQHDCKTPEFTHTTTGMASPLAGLDGRAKASEHFFMAREEQLALVRHVEGLVATGKAPQAMLDKLTHNLSRTATARQHTIPAAFAEVPTTINNQPVGYVYNHVQHGPPRPAPPKSAKPFAGLGSPVSFGSARWSAHGASVFSVADGKRLAQTPVRETMVPWEQARHSKILAAAQETPLLYGFRVLPEMTPGRALFWGSMLAMFGTVLTVKLAALQLGIRNAEDAPIVLRGIVQPAARSLAARLQPLKQLVRAGCAVLLCIATACSYRQVPHVFVTFQVPAGGAAQQREAVSRSEFASSLRRQLS